MASFAAAAAYVGDHVLSSILGVIFDKLFDSHFVDFFRGSKQYKTLLTELKLKLFSIDALADDAERKQFTDPRVRNWLLQAKDVVLDAEDLLGEIHYELTKCQVEEAVSQSTNKVMKLLKSFSVSSFEKETESRMKQILETIDLLNGDDLGLRKHNSVGVGSGSGSYISWKLASTSLPNESVVYGRDGDKENIINWLTSDTDNKLSILSIVGMGGLGKTTLAQLVYNDSRIEGKFDIRAWVCVSDDFDVFKVTRTILDAITKSNDNSRNLEMVHERLKNEVTGKKFLLVLDDVWNEEREKWELVQKPLLFGAQGSRILVTTRSKKVASTMWSKEQELKLLQEVHCWQLFAEHAFPDDNLQRISYYKEIGMKIVEKCDRLPLALKSIGSLLRNKLSVSEWESVLRSEIWELKDSNIIPALALSYCHLPSYLKRCFAYCALFPKDYLFDKECLIQFWMAQKFLQCPQQSSMSLEEVGEQYLNDLLSRSFFQQSSKEDGTAGFVMHDLLNDLAKYVCGDICFRWDVNQAKSIPNATRHFSIDIDHAEYFGGFGTIYDAKRLRTYIPTTVGRDFLYPWYCKISIDELFSKFKFIRILSLDYCLHLTKLPDSIGNLKHLCSLDLSSTDIEELSESICSLYNLQILKLNDCSYLKELPSNLPKLTNLCRLELVKTKLRKMPSHLRKLENLQVLMTSFNVGESSEFNIQQLGELNIRGKLSIKNLQEIQNASDASAVDLKNKTHLVKLKLEWDFGRNPDDPTKEREEIVIENLHPSKNLTMLSINNYSGKILPSWFRDDTLLNLVSLTLFHCKYCECLPPLGHLQFLKDLQVIGLNEIVSIEADFFGSGSDSFPSLESLMFLFMKEWRKWECQDGTNAFPRLQCLSVIGCPKLKGNLPEQLHHLKKLQIRQCEQLVTSLSMAREIHELRHSMLESVEIDHCRGMHIPMNCHHNFIVELTIDTGCDSLTTFWLDIFPTLRSLNLMCCPNLQMILQGNVHNHLRDMKIFGCPHLQSLPTRMHILLPSLESLGIAYCPKVELSREGRLPSNLKWLHFLGCSKIINSLLNGDLGEIPPLETLGIDVGEVEVESFPDEGMLPPSLISLRILGGPNLRKLDYKGLCYLSSLKELSLQECPVLECLPDEGLPNSISKFHIDECPLLNERCEEHGGEDWHKISHINFQRIPWWSWCAFK